MQLTLHKDWLKSCQWNLFKTSNTYRQASRKLLFCLRGKKWVVWQKVEFTALIDIRQQNDTATTSSRRLDPRRYYDMSEEIHIRQIWPTQYICCYKLKSLITPQFSSFTTLYKIYIHLCFADMHSLLSSRAHCNH